MAKQQVKKAIPASDPRYKKMTPAQRNANTVQSLKDSFKMATPSKPAPKKPTNTQKVAANKAKVVANKAKVVVNAQKVADNKAKVEANRKKVTAKPKTPTKSTGPTVSQLWTEKTGLAWSEAKKRGLSDGSLNSNLALMKKLKSGEVSKSSLESKTSTTASTTTSAIEEIPQGLGKISVESRLSEMEPKPKLAQIRTEYSAPKKPQTRKEIRQENRRMRKMKKGGTYKSVIKKRK